MVIKTFFTGLTHYICLHFCFNGLAKLLFIFPVLYGCWVMLDMMAMLISVEDLKVVRLCYYSRQS